MGSGGNGMFGDAGMYDANGNLMPTEQHSRSLKYVGQGLGSAIGGIWGPVGSMIGGIAGKQAGGNLGNLFAGKNAFTGRGDFWSNFDPMITMQYGGPKGSPMPGASMFGMGNSFKPSAAQLAAQQPQQPANGLPPIPQSTPTQAGSAAPSGLMSMGLPGMGGIGGTGGGLGFPGLMLG